MQNQWTIRVLLPVVMALFLFCHNAQALINGEVTPENNVSTLRIHIEHAHYLHSVAKWDYYDSNCSAVVVGTHPLTLLTAAHCLREVRLLQTNKLPAIAIMHPAQFGIQQPKLTQAYFQPYEAVAEDVTKDIAVLVFDAVVDNTVTPVPIQFKHPNQAQTVQICGYGLGYYNKPTDVLRCAKRTYLDRFETFSSVLPAEYKTLDEMLYLKSQAQFDYTKEIAKEAQSLIAINRLNALGRYDEDVAMITEGDSGGPWLIKGKDNKHRLLAISTLVERFYNKNIFWTFFKKDTPLADYSYVAYGLKLASPSVYQFLKQCKEKGADISFD